MTSPRPRPLLPPSSFGGSKGFAVHLDHILYKTFQIACTIYTVSCTLEQRVRRPPLQIIFWLRWPYKIQDISNCMTKKCMTYDGTHVQFTLYILWWSTDWVKKDTVLEVNWENIFTNTFLNEKKTIFFKWKKNLFKLLTLFKMTNTFWTTKTAYIEPCGKVPSVVQFAKISLRRWLESWMVHQHLA